MKQLTTRVLNVIVFSSAISVSGICFASGDDITDPIAHGEQAHKNHCYKCLSDDIYTRENRIVKSIDALSKQVLRCKDNIGIPWFDEDADAVVQFLNKKYYRF